MTGAQGPGTPPQEVVERALALSKTDGCVVLVEEVTGANLRWAANTLTTNGIERGREVTVVAIAGESAGVVSRQGVTDGSLEDLVRAAEHAAQSAPPADEAMPLVRGRPAGGDWGAPPAETSIAVFSGFAEALGEAFRRAAASEQLLFGFAEHEMRTTYAGSSAGMRARHDQPTG
ncbi:MAG: PmbA/TldA family metallopeptidase, partial [Acidimicrobiales bacterium]